MKALLRDATHVLLLIGTICFQGLILPTTTSAAGCELHGRFQPFVRQIPQVVGACTAPETYDPSTGDIQQTTTRGQLRSRGIDGLEVFVETSAGSRTWILGPKGVEMLPPGAKIPDSAPAAPFGTWDDIGPDAPAASDEMGPEAPDSWDQTVANTNDNDNTNTLNNTNTINATGGNATGGAANAQGGSSNNVNANSVNPVINIGVNTGGGAPPAPASQAPAAPTPPPVPALPGQTVPVPTPTSVAPRATAPAIAPTPLPRPTPGEPADGLPTSARIEFASGAVVTIALNPGGAPQTVQNFTGKVAAGFYDGLTFHRVEDWVVQGGDPTGTGKGGGTMPTELNDVPFAAGAIGMARGSDASISNDAQFFIVKRAAFHLNGRYANFGQVTAGLDAIAQVVVGDRISRITVSP